MYYARVVSPCAKIIIKQDRDSESSGYMVKGPGMLATVEYSYILEYMPYSTYEVEFILLCVYIYMPILLRWGGSSALKHPLSLIPDMKKEEGKELETKYNT